MQLNIGTKIRELRRRDGRTQDNLAEALGVTAQAVSRWESGGSYPDMEVIPSIANYFGVSIDELFGYDNVREKRIDEIVEQLTEMNKENNGINVNIDDCIRIARTALAEFPANEKILLCLAQILVTAGYVKYHEHHLTNEEGYDVYDVERHRMYGEWAEAIVIYEKLIPVLADGPARHKAMKQLAQLYLNIGEHGKARVLAEKAPDMNCCKEFLMLSACDGKERAAEYGATVLDLLGLAAELIGDAVAANYDHITIEEAERYIKNAADIFDVICLDGEYGRYRVHSADMYLYLSTLQWRSGKHDAAFESLDKALIHAKKCDEFSLDTEITFGSPLLKNVKRNPGGKDYKEYVTELHTYWPWICIPDAQDVASEMQADPRWNEWIAKLKK
jgi:transcriptional regulator with XRE-family HTH domain